MPIATMPSITWNPRLADTRGCCLSWSGVRCAQPAVVMLELGCEHEHVATHAVCAGHQDDGIIRGFVAGFTAYCGSCGHDCRVLGRLGPLPATS